MIFGLAGILVGESLGAGVKRVDVNIHAHARLRDINDDHAYYKGQRSHGHEIDKREPADFADRFKVLHARNTGNNSTEDQRGNDHLDELDEAGPQRLHFYCQLRVKMSKQNADTDRN